MARNGNEALELVRAFDPQVVTLDIQMPGMDGLTCLSRIMIEAPRPVVMISSLTAEGAEATLEAIELGAVDFIAKPSGAVSLEIDRLRPLLVEKVRAASSARIRRTLRLTERVRHQIRGAGLASRPRPAAPHRHRARRSGRRGMKLGSGILPGLVLIGTSTGGPAALDIVLPQLPPDFPWPILVAQHLPASFTGAFAKRLDRECHLECRRGQSTDAPEAGHHLHREGRCRRNGRTSGGRRHRDAGARQGQLFMASERGTHGGQRA